MIQNKQKMDCFAKNNGESKLYFRHKSQQNISQLNLDEGVKEFYRPIKKLVKVLNQKERDLFSIEEP